MRRVWTAASSFLVWAGPGVALAQTQSPKPNINWVFWLSVGVAVVSFLGGLGFLAVYYVFAVLARSRRFATPVVVAQAPTPAPASARPAPPPPPPPPAAPAAAAAPPAPAAARAPAPAPAAAAAPPAPAAPGAPAPAPAPAPAAAPPPAAAAPSGLPRIDPNNLPEGIDAVTRGRLKKLAVLQERGQAPPPDLVAELEPVLARMGAAPAAPAPPQAAPAPAVPAPPQAPAPPPEAETPPPAPPAAETPPPAPAPAPGADTSGLPRIDPNNLPPGIDAVTRGRLKKLAVLQERGQAPPADLLEHLRPILDQMA